MTNLRVMINRDETNLMIDSFAPLYALIDRWHGIAHH